MSELDIAERYYMKLVTAAIILLDNKLLLARRSTSEKLAGFWEFPGGKVESGETPQECVVRELAEELGVAVHAGAILGESFYEYEHGAFTIIGIEAKLLTSEFTLTVHDRIEWVPLTEAGSYKLLPADFPLLQQIIDRLSKREES